MKTEFCKEYGTDRSGKNEIFYTIHEHIGILTEHQNGWSNEVNIVSWNGNEPKLDIREWDENHERMAKGITLKLEEAITLKSLLNKTDIIETMSTQKER